MHQTKIDQVTLDVALARSPELAALIAATTKFFGGTATLCESYDPEFPDDKYLQISVRTRLQPEQIVLAESEWIAAMMKISPTWEDLRLRIEPT